MISCRLTLGLVCLLAIVGGICVLALQIVTATTRAWVSVSIQQSSLPFGIFSQEATFSMVTLTMVKNSALVCLQAMLVFSVGFGLAAVIAIMIGGTQSEICGHGTYFYVRIADICFVLSAITNLVGIAVFTHFWIKEPQTFFHPTPAAGASYNYGYAYMLGWFVFFLQAGLAAFTIVGIHVVVRKYDKKLAEGDDSVDERKKLVGSQEPKQTKDEFEQGSSKTQSQPVESTSTPAPENIEEHKVDLGADEAGAEIPKNDNADLISEANLDVSTTRKE